MLEHFENYEKEYRIDTIIQGVIYAVIAIAWLSFTVWVYVLKH